MDNQKIGDFINKRRKEKKLTQRELADRLNLSDKTISKWETGLGFPDIASINDLAEALDVNVSELLSGEEVKSSNNAGNMKKMKLYVCPKCGNVITSTNELILNCCGTRLGELKTDRKADEGHQLQIENVEDEMFIRIEHPMTKEHYIMFIAYVTSDKLTMSRLYPEQNAEVRFNIKGHGILYVYCSQHGLYRKII